MPKDSDSFLDTNILVYEWDEAHPEKCEIAAKLINDLGRRGVVSSQVIQEFAHAAKHKLGFEPESIVKILSDYERFRFIPIQSQTVRLAVLTSRDSQLSFWDALIIEAAVAANCKRLYTEDLNHGQLIRGIRVLNPFRDS